jgi:hypothetical protein
VEAGVDVYATRELGGERACFVRLAPGDIVVADVGGQETLTPRAQWLALPLWQAGVRYHARSSGNRDAVCIGDDLRDARLCRVPVQQSAKAPLTSDRLNLFEGRVSNEQRLTLSGSASAAVN